jgi:Zn-dependent protease
VAAVDGPWRRTLDGGPLRVGRLLGVPVGVSPALAGVAVAGASAAWLVGGRVWSLLAGAVVVGASLLTHELAHAVVARYEGYRVDGIVLSLLGGVTAWSGPSPPPHVAVRVAAAGPATSAVLACGFVGLGSLAGGLDGLLAVGAVVNLLDALVNLLPLPTSDGREIARALRRTRPATSAG